MLINLALTVDVWHAFFGEGRIPDNWTPRSSPVTFPALAKLIVDIYKKNPVPVGPFSNGSNATEAKFPDSPEGLDCFLFNALESDMPSSLKAWIDLAAKMNGLPVPSC